MIFESVFKHSKRIECLDRVGVYSVDATSGSIVRTILRTSEECVASEYEDCLSAGSVFNDLILLLS